MVDRARIVRLERTHNAEGRGEDMDESIGCAEEEVRGASA